MKLLKRKQIRISQYNYSNIGDYFITICTKDKKCVLSKIIQNESNSMPKLILLPFGEVTDKYIHSINKTYNDIMIRDYVIMPNHIHFICSILKNCGYENTPANNKLAMLVSTFKRLINKECNEKIWQRNYYEHIIRNEKEYLKILEYINENPYKWNNDKYYV